MPHGAPCGGPEPPVAMRVEVERAMLHAMASPSQAEPDWLRIVALIQRHGKLAASTHIFDVEAGIKLSPLHLAARFGRAGYADLFIARGSDVNADRPDRYSQSALLYCASAPTTAPATAVPVTAAAFANAAREEALADTIRVLARCGADIEARCSEDRCPLNALGHAVKCGSIPRARALLAAGAQVNSRFKDGSTSLHIAARRGDEHMAKLLVHYGASTDVLSSSTRTPAEEAYWEGHEELGHYLHLLHKNQKFRFVRD